MESLSHRLATTAALLVLLLARVQWTAAKPATSTRVAAASTVDRSLVSSATEDWEYSVYFEESDCSDVPPLVIATAECSLYSSDGDMCAVYSPYGLESDDSIEIRYYQGCTDDLSSLANKLYGNNVYLRRDYYDDANCSEIYGSDVMAADGECHYRVTTSASMEYLIVVSAIATINADGSATISKYSTSDCSGEVTSVISISAELLSSGACDSDSTIASTNAFSLSESGGVVDGTANDGEEADSAAVGGGDSSDGGLSTGAIVGIVIGAVAFLAIIAGFVVWRRRKNENGVYREMPAADN